MQLSPSAITITGPKAAATLRVHSVDGREALSELFEYKVEFLSEVEDVDLKALLGEAITVHLPIEDQDTRHFSGIVVAASRLGWRGRYASFLITLAPQLWLLTRSGDCRIFQEQSVPEVVTELFRSAGLNFRENLFFKQYRKWDYLTQYRESDYDFIRRVLAHEGIYFYFEHTEDAHQIVLADSESAHDLKKGFEAVPLIRPMEKHEFPDYLSQWTAHHAIQTSGVTLGDYEFRLRGKAARLQAQHKVDAEHSHGVLMSYGFPGRSTLAENQDEADAGKSLEEGERLARVRVEEQRCELQTFAGDGTARGLATGYLFGITNAHPDQQFLITSTIISLRNSLFESGEDPAGERCQIKLEAIDSKTPYRPLRKPKPTMPGPQTARVVGPADQEIWTDKLGRIRIQLHWDREGEYDENSACWVRVAQPWAGNRWGVVFNPRIGNEVVVEFLDGDPDRPLVTGSVYNAENMPPYVLPGNQTQSGIKTRSSKDATDQNFNEIRFEDMKGQEELHVQAERDQTTNVKRNQSISVGGDRSISVTGNQSVTISGKGQSPVHSTVNVTGKHTFDASDTIKIQAPTSITLECGGSTIVMEPGKIAITAGDGAQIVLDANALTQASGGGMTLHDANVCHTASGGGQVLIDANVCGTASGGGQLLLDANVTAQSAGGSTLQLDSNAAMSGTAKATVSGAVEATLDASGGSVKATPASVAVSAPTVDVSGQAMVSIAGAMVKIN